MKDYRKKPVVIQAQQWDGTLEGVPWELRQNTYSYMDGSYLVVMTLEGDIKASPGDFIIKGIKGEFYPCKSDIFWATYEEA